MEWNADISRGGSGERKFTPEQSTHRKRSLEYVNNTNKSFNHCLGAVGENDPLCAEAQVEKSADCTSVQNVLTEQTCSRYKPSLSHLQWDDPVVAADELPDITSSRVTTMG